MNEICLNCMEKLEEKQSVCSACGCKKNRLKNKKGQIPAGSIVAGKYLIGRAFNQNINSIFYLAYDMEKQLKVIICEYFPKEYAKRDQTNGIKVIPKSSKSIDSFIFGKNKFEKREEEGKLVQDLFLSNGSVYTVYDFVESVVENKKKCTKKRYILLAAIVGIAIAFLLFTFIEKMNKNAPSASPTIPLFEEYSVGSTITFGKYRKDVEIKPIEWTVLARKDDKALIITKDCIESCLVQPWTDELFGWDTSYLREKLNTDFYDSAFSEQEKIAILETEICADENPDFSCYQGENTQDKVFVLSAKEAGELFKNNDTRAAAPTIYAQKSEYGVEKKENGNCTWWLRTNSNPNEYGEELFCVVDCNGRVDTTGENSMWYFGVRPVVWIDLSKFADINKTENTEERNEIVFGNYMGEDIEWWVVDTDKDDGKVFLISKYCLDCQPFHLTDSEVVWGNSSLREWLNGDFYQTAFDKNEQSKITYVETEKCKDSITILSYQEIINIFGHDALEYLNTGTTYATEKFIDDYESKYETWEYGINIIWWTRTSEDEVCPHESEKYKVCMNGENADSSFGKVTSVYGIRPVMYVEDSILK